MLKMFIAGYAHGHIGELFQIIKGTGTIVGAWRVFPDFKEAFAASCPGVPVYEGDLSQVLCQVDCDVVAVGDMYGLRGRWIIEALKAGRHVITDKPLCTNLEELEEIRRLSAENRLSVGLMLPLWSHANAVAARKIVQDGLLGEVQGVDFLAHHPLNYGTRPSWYWEKSMHGGTINDIAPHAVDGIEYITGLKLNQLCQARTWNQAFPEVPHFHNAAQFMATLSNGGGVLADVSYFAPRFSLPSYWRFTFWGTKGWLEFSYDLPGVRFSDKFNALQNFFPIESKENYWTSFMKEMSGEEPGYFSTHHVLDVTETTLKLQSCAR